MCFVPIKVMVTIKAHHMTAPITLGNENAAFRATALSIVWPIYILLKSLQCLDHCIVWTSVKFGLAIDTTKSFWQEVECVKSTSFASVYALVSSAAVTKRHCIGRLF